MICIACKADRHDKCSAQVLAAKSPCDCEYCWGKGGSKGFLSRLLDENSDIPITVVESQKE
jgi:hypothetical protein